LSNTRQTFWVPAGAEIFNTFIREGIQKFPELFKKTLFKYSYKFETLITLKVLPFLLDAAIPMPLPLLETLSKIFNGNAVKTSQRFSWNLCKVRKTPPF
jgi:hypothetical protein